MQYRIEFTGFVIVEADSAEDAITLTDDEDSEITREIKYKRPIVNTEPLFFNFKGE